MSFPQAVVAGCGLPRNRELRARLQPHLDADPELLTALLVHLELARDLGVPAAARRVEPAAASAEPDATRAALRRTDHEPR